MPTESAFHIIFEGVNNRLEYLVARVDDVYDRVDDMGKAMQASETKLSNQMETLTTHTVAKADCDNCQAQWVPRRWAKPFVAACGFLLLMAGIAGDWVDALAKMGWRP